MTIYFAGSIRGGREDAKLYGELINFIKRYGTVLTEHIGDQTLTEENGEGFDSQYIYDRDLKWLGSADILIAEVSTPSLGVGFEIANAIQLEKKVLCLYNPRKGKTLSSMIAGCPQVTNVEYITIDEAKYAVDHFLKNLQFPTK
jgi:nucleoside 2-deoxyribosyltransferase